MSEPLVWHEECMRVSSARGIVAGPWGRPLKPDWKVSLLWEREYKERCGNKRPGYLLQPFRAPLCPSSSFSASKAVLKAEWAVASVDHVKYALRWRSRAVFTVLYRAFFDAPGTKYVSSFLTIQWGDYLTPHILPNPHYYQTQTLTYVKRISFLIIEQVWIMCDIQPIESEKNLPKTTYCDQSKHIFFINIEYKVS